MNRPTKTPITDGVFHDVPEGGDVVTALLRCCRELELQLNTPPVHMSLDRIVKGLLASERWDKRENGEVSPSNETVIGSDARYKIEPRGDTDWCSKGESHPGSLTLWFPSDDPYCGKRYCVDCLRENFT